MSSSQLYVKGQQLRKVCLSFWHRGTNSGLPCGPCLPRKSHICVILPATKHGHQKQPVLCLMHREQRNLCPPPQGSSSLSCRPRGGSLITPRVLGPVSEQRSPPELHRCSLATRRVSFVATHLDKSLWYGREQQQNHEEPISAFKK